MTFWQTQRILMTDFIKQHCLIYLIIFSSLILLISSSLKHLLYQSTAWDLGIFDQAIFLISQNTPPISSFLGIHILGDHAALIFYPLAILYKLYPSVYWLFFVQAIALSWGAFFIYQLAKQSELKEALALTLSGVYLLYPLIFNINLFDFHTDVIALSAIFWAILAVRRRNLWGFMAALILMASCKGILGITIAAMGLWLILEKERLYGAIALIFGSSWFLIASKIIIPYFTQNTHSIDRHLSRYSYLGDSYLAILKNLFINPLLILGGLFNGTNFGYLLLLLIPLIWGLIPRRKALFQIKTWYCFLPLIAALPTLLMNLLANDPGQKDLLHQYSLPILPFLLLIIINLLKEEKTLLRRPRWIILWSLITFFALAKLGYFTSRYLSSLDTWQATNNAIAQIKTQGGVFTSAEIAPHLTHRPLVKLTTNGSESLDLNQFDYVLLNLRHPGWESSPELLHQFREKVEKISEFQLSYQKDDVMLFSKKTS